MQWEWQGETGKPSFLGPGEEPSTPAFHKPAGIPVASGHNTIDYNAIDFNLHLLNHFICPNFHDMIHHFSILSFCILMRIF